MSHSLFLLSHCRAATDNLPVRESPMDKLDELEIVSSLLHRMPNVFAEVLGAVDTGILVSSNLPLPMIQFSFSRFFRRSNNLLLLKLNAAKP